MPPNETPRQRTARLRAEARAANLAFRQQFAAQHIIGSSDRPDLYPERWIMSDQQQAFNTQPSEFVASNIRLRLKPDKTGLRLSFTVRAASLPDQDRYTDQFDGQANDVHIIGARRNKEDFLTMLERYPLARIVERIQGYQPGTIDAVTEVSIAEAWNG